jgi:adenylosuccinate lyase
MIAALLDVLRAFTILARARHDVIAFLAERQTGFTKRTGEQVHFAKRTRVTREDIVFDQSVAVVLDPRPTIG